MLLGGRHPRYVPKNIETIVLELEKLLGNILDGMPRPRPVLGCDLSENRQAANVDPIRVQHRMIDERRALTTKARRNYDDGPETLFNKKVSDLIGGIETDRFDFPYSNDLRIRNPRQSSHQFCNALGHDIGLSGHEYS